MKKNFNDVYESIYKEWNEILKKLKEQKYLIISRGIIILVINIIISIIISSYNVLFVGLFIIDVMSIKYIDARRLLKAYFEKNAIEQIIKSCKSVLVYKPTCGITLYEYNESNFNQLVDGIKSKHLIEGQVTNRVYVKMSQVKAFNYADKVIKNYEGVIFEGLFGYCKLIGRNISFVKVEENKRKEELNINRVEIDSIKFEKAYDIFSKDKIQAMQIFNSEVIELINKFREQTGNILNLVIHKDKIFFRITCQELFEDLAENGKVEYSKVYNWYKMIQMPIEILDKIVENIEQIN